MAALPASGKIKPANTRRTTVKQRGNQHVLDVAVRSSHAVRQRTRRTLRFAFRITLALALGAGLFFGGKKALAWLLLKNPDYNVAELRVETDGVLTPDAVFAAADLHKGGNIFLVNLNRAKAKIEALPQVEKAQVNRQLPNRILVQITERHPVAWIAPEHGGGTREEITRSKESFLIDSHAVLLPSAYATAQDRFLPIIRSYTSGPRADGQEAEGEEIKAALDLLHAHQDSPLSARFQIQEIDLSKQFGLQVTDRAGLQVLFGLEEMDRQLKRLDVALQVFEHRSEKVQSINLLAQKNVPVTFVSEPVADLPPAAAPAMPSPSPASVKPPVAAKDKTKPEPGPKAKHKEAAATPKPAADKHRVHHAIQPFESDRPAH